MVMTNLDWALTYAEAGLRVFPVHTIRNGVCSCGRLNACKPGKHPVGALVPHGLRNAATDPALIKAWWCKIPDANIGIATGPESNLVVLDIDGPDGETIVAAIEHQYGPLPATASVKTSKGRHLYFAYPKNGTRVKSVSRKKLNIDVRGDGGFVVAPPSIHESGHVYKFIKTDCAILPECPAAIIALAAGDVKVETGPAVPPHISCAATESNYGKRHSREAFRINPDAPPVWSVSEEARVRSPLQVIPAFERQVWLNVGMALHWTNWREPAFRIWDEWSRTCPEKYNEADQRKTWTSFERPYDGAPITTSTIFHMAAQRGWKDTRNPDARREPSQREKLISIGLDADLWHDSDGNTFATVKIDQHEESFSIRSSAFHHWLTREYGEQNPFTAKGKTCPSAPSTQTLKEAISALGAKAARGPEYQAAVRVGEHGGLIYLDLGTSDWSAVEISATGWRIIASPPVRFIRPAGFRPLPVPVMGGNILELRKSVNVASDADFVLIVSYLIVVFRPAGPYPVLIINGEQGSGKTISCRVLRRLVDPNAAELRNDTREERDLLLAAKNGRIVALDNLSYVRNDFSDAICRIATKGAFATRKLYTDDEEFFLEVARPVLLNGIPPLAQRADLADRAVVCTLPTMDDGKMCSEDEFWSEFEIAWPRILGALLDGVSGALRDYRSIKLQCSPRMMDFAKWAEAGCRALGAPAGSFERAYAANRSNATEEALDADPVAVAAVDLINKSGHFVGTATELLSALEGYVLPTQRDRRWPKDATRLSSHLRRLPPLLRPLGIVIDFSRSADAARKRLIEIKRVGPK
jgi:hypothetical protein